MKGNIMGANSGANQANKMARRVEAENRAKARAARSDAEQFGRLMDAGHGHCREAQRLAEKIANADA